MGEKMQADGSGANPGNDEGEKTSGAGESGGGSYPNPHPGKAPKSGFMGHGGQTDIDYHGPGQLGDDEIDGTPQPNSATRGE